jgi:hypothetical protein
VSASRPRRAALVAARRVKAFGQRHAVAGDASVRGTLVRVGHGATRLVLVGCDGTFGDLVLRGPRTAATAAELAGVRLLEPDDRELGEALRTGPSVWARMAGLQLGHGR